MSRIRIALLLTLAAGAVPACQRPNRPLQTSEASAPLPAAARTRVEVSLAGGQIDFEVGEADTISASFRYDHDDMKPRIDVSEADGAVTAKLLADAPGWRPGIGPTMNLWTVRLPKDRPIDLVVALGGGFVELPALPLTLASVDARITFGNGEATFDLTEASWTDTLNVSLEIGSGPGTRVFVPKDAGVRLQAIHSLGTIDVPDLKKQNDETWKNERYGEAERTIELSARVGTGDLTVVTGPRPAPAPAPEEDGSSGE